MEMVFFSYTRAVVVREVSRMCIRGVIPLDGCGSFGGVYMFLLYGGCAHKIMMVTLCEAMQTRHKGFAVPVKEAHQQTAYTTMCRMCAQTFSFAYFYAQTKPLNYYSD